MKKYLSLIFILVAALVLTGCEFDVESLTQATNNSFVHSNIDYEDWTKITDGMEIKEIAVISDLGLESDVVTAIKIEQDKFNFELVQESQAKSAFDWQEELNALLVVNAAFFNESYLPTGYLKSSDGAEYGNAYMEGENGYTGAFIINDEGQVELRYLPTQNYGLAELDGFEATLQTFPTLILPGGVASIINDSSKTANRTVLAESKSGDFYIFLSQQNSLTLLEMQDFLLNFEDKLDIAINLDGGTSSGVSIESGDFDYHLSSFYVPSVIAIYE